MMMLDYSFGLTREAKAIENAVDAVFEQGYRTLDLCGPEHHRVSTTEMGELVCTALTEQRD